MPCGKWRKSPEEFTDTTELPRKKSGPTYQNETSPGGSESQPDGVTEYGTFHGDTPHKNVSISESDPYPGKGSVSGGPPDEVDGPFNDKP